MSSAFKPLVPSTSVSRSGPAVPGKFSPLVPSATPAKSAIAGGTVPKSMTSAAAATMRSPASVPEPAQPCTNPAVTNVIRDGDRITHIEVKCGCGEVITIECGY